MELNEMVILLIILLFGIYFYYVNREIIKFLVNVNYIKCYGNQECKDMLKKYPIIEIKK